MSTKRKIQKFTYVLQGCDSELMEGMLVTIQAETKALADEKAAEWAKRFGKNTKAV